MQELAHMWMCLCVCVKEKVSHKMLIGNELLKIRTAIKFSRVFHSSSTMIKVYTLRLQSA